MDSYSSQAQSFSDLHSTAVSCGNARHNKQGFPTKMGPRTFRLIKCDVVYRVKVGTRAKWWKDKRGVYVYLLTNMHVSFKGRLFANFVLSIMTSNAAGA
jgi:hypothetical protein